VDLFYVIYDLKGYDKPKLDRWW